MKMDGSDSTPPLAIPSLSVGPGFGYEFDVNYSIVCVPIGYLVSFFCMHGSTTLEVWDEKQR